MANLYYKSGDEWLPLGGGSLPVGSYVYSDNNVSPAADMGGTWQSLGYTAVDPVFYSIVTNNDTTEATYGTVMRIFNTVIAFGASQGNPFSTDVTLDFSSLPATNDFQAQGYDPAAANYPMRSVAGRSYRLSSGNMLVAMYETTEPLSTSVSGGKYLFKRTA